MLIINKFKTTFWTEYPRPALFRDQGDAVKQRPPVAVSTSALLFLNYDDFMPERVLQQHIQQNKNYRKYSHWSVLLFILHYFYGLPDLKQT